MTNRERSAKLVKKVENIFRCPICGQSMKVLALKSLVCSNNHTFDFARQGYINMLNRPSNQRYDKELFEARRKIISESTLYAPLHKMIVKILGNYLDENNNPTIVFDAGSGEGSHLQKTIAECHHREIVGVGLDIAKEGIIMASQRYGDSVWLVGDLTNIPLKDQSCHLILNILSPANYAEFKRILTAKGVLVKVIPGSNYLRELRDAIFADTDKSIYSNDETVSLFKENFCLLGNFRLSYFAELQKTEIMKLAQMSPLAWNVDRKKIDSFLNQNHTGVTVDLNLLLGKSRG